MTNEMVQAYTEVEPIVLYPGAACGFGCAETACMSNANAAVMYPSGIRQGVEFSQRGVPTESITEL